MKDKSKTALALVPNCLKGNEQHNMPNITTTDMVQELQHSKKDDLCSASQYFDD